MNFDDVLEKFVSAANDLKDAYAEKEGMNSNYLMIVYDENHYTTIIPTDRTGSYIGAFRA